jgi:hypothetical protein
MSLVANTLPSPLHQAEQLIELGVHEPAGLSAHELRAAAADATDAADFWQRNGARALLAVHPDLAPASSLAELVCHGGKNGFVVEDMTDVDSFAPIESAVPPASPLYFLHDLDRGDHMSNWTPDEALPAIAAAERTPLLLAEGIHWLLQQPTALERNHCFMTIGSRLRTRRGAQDSRTPAIWLSNGTGRDGAARRNAPKIGWCWAGNRHNWLGFASVARRTPHSMTESRLRIPYRDEY